jgi:two-component system sensor histidine kinase YcbA
VIIIQDFKNMLLIATIVGLGSQINLTYTIPGFIITLAVILLVTLMYIFEVNYYKTILLTAIISPLIRGLILISLNHSLHETITAVAPDVVFYVTFGAIFYLFDDFVHENLTNFIVIVFFSDILSNIMKSPLD